MAQVPKRQPLSGIDSIGKSDVGTQHTEKPTGSPWEMGIAVPLRNRKFERGTLLEYRLSSDSYGKSRVLPRDTQFGIEAVNRGPQNTPSNFIQHGDKAMLGLSTSPDWPNHSEFIRIGAVGEVLKSLTAWKNGEIYPLDRANKFGYQSGDRVTVYGTGCGDNWMPLDQRIQTLGLQRGISSLNRRGRYKPQQGQIEVYEDAMADDHLAFEIQLPSHSNYNSSLDSGNHSRSWGNMALLPFRTQDYLSVDNYDWFYEDGPNSGIFRFMLSKNTDGYAKALYTADSPGGLAEYNIRISGANNSYLKKDGSDSIAQVGDSITSDRFTSLIRFDLPSGRGLASGSNIPNVRISDGSTEITIDFGGDTISDYENDPLSFAQVIIDAINAEPNFAVYAELPPGVFPVGFPFYIRAINNEVSFVSDINFDNEVKTPLILGFNHPGGHTTDYAQALLSIANNESKKDGSFYENIGVLSQVIKPVSPRYSGIISQTEYRMGVTWKGYITPDIDPSNFQGSEFFVGFRWSPLVGQGSQDHYQNSMMSTKALLDESHPTQDQWRTDLVSSKVNEVELDSLGDDESNRIDIVLKSRGQDSYIDNSSGQGIELMAFIDQIWLEHQGDVPGGENGCVIIDHFPNQDTLAVNRRPIQEEETLTMANGQQFNVSSVLTGDKRRYEIDADFVNIPLNVYDKFRALLRWQDRGYHLTLHPYLPGVPHCLIGRVEITNEQKNHWDLNRYTFHFKFTEQD